MIRKIHIIIIFLIIGNLSQGCFSVKTEDPIDAYYYWAGNNPPKEVNVIHADYWHSPHFSLEYIFYLKATTSKKWINSFIKLNDLVIDSTEFKLPDDKPEWFLPNKDYIQFKLNDDFDQGTRYFIDTLNSKVYFYEIQL